MQGFQFSAISGALLLGRLCHHSPDWMMGPVWEQSDVVGRKGEGCLVCGKMMKWWWYRLIDMTLWPDLWRIRCTSQGFPEVCGFSQFSHEVLQDLVVAQPALLRSALYSGRGGLTSAVVLPLKLDVDDTIQKADWQQAIGSILIYQMTCDGDDHAWSSLMFLTKPRSKAGATLMTWWRWSVTLSSFRNQKKILQRPWLAMVLRYVSAAWDCSRRSMLSCSHCSLSSSRIDLLKIHCILQSKVKFVTFVNVSATPDVFFVPSYFRTCDLISEVLKTSLVWIFKCACPFQHMPRARVYTCGPAIRTSNFGTGGTGLFCIWGIQLLPGEFLVFFLRFIYGITVVIA